MSRSHHSNSGEPSQRMLRVAELIRHAAAQLLSRGEVVDPVLDGHVVTVPKVRGGADLKRAAISGMPRGGREGEGVIAALDRHRKYMRGEIAHRVNLKFAPELRFRIDDSFDNAARIDALLHSPKVAQDLQQDLQQPEAPEGDEP